MILLQKHKKQTYQSIKVKIFHRFLNYCTAGNRNSLFDQYLFVIVHVFPKYILYMRLLGMIPKYIDIHGYYLKHNVTGSRLEPIWDPKSVILIN